MIAKSKTLEGRQSGEQQRCSSLVESLCAPIGPSTESISPIDAVTEAQIHLLLDRSLMVTLLPSRRPPNLAFVWIISIQVSRSAELLPSLRKASDNLENPNQYAGDYISIQET